MISRTCRAASRRRHVGHRLIPTKSSASQLILGAAQRAGPPSFSFPLASRTYSASPIHQSWWNPFARGSGERDGSALLASIRGNSVDEAESPRRLQERKDMMVALLALQFRQLYIASPDTPREELIDQAFDALEEKELDEKTLLQLRHELQSSLQDQVVDIFKAFEQADALLPDPHDEMDSELWESSLQTEWQFAKGELDHSKGAPKGANPQEFLSQKIAAIEMLLERRQHYRETLAETSKDSEEKTDPTLPEADPFGYHETIDDERNMHIRHYQTVNLCRSALIRQQVGYSVVAMKSSVPNAGRGVFVDGYAPAGSILAFQPGKIWTKEHLVNLPIEIEKELERNDNYQMSLRPDDHMIDSRNSPYTVLTGDNSNPFALGHVVNHPTPTKPFNSKTVAVNFSESMELTPAQKRYIPNTYARPRTLTIMGSLFDREAVEAHGICLIATRDICNEEIFYDYRLVTSQLPTWYHRVEDLHFDEVEEEKADEAKVEQ